MEYDLKNMAGKKIIQTFAVQNNKIVRI